jgi:hypothetical protein
MVVFFRNRNDLAQLIGTLEGQINGNDGVEENESTTGEPVHSISTFF